MRGEIMDDRKLRILAAVVDEYIITGEPVGSKAIMKYVGASSATIRNEMAELEKQGYLEQPHTSAGRVPTYNGYRLYVDQLLKTDPLSAEEKRILDEMIPKDEYSEEGIVRSAQNALAELTQAATFVSSESPKFSVISKVEVIPTGKRLYVLLMIASNGKIKNRTCRVEIDLTQEHLDYFSRFLRENLEGVPINLLSEEMLTKLETAMGTYLLTLSPLIRGVFDMTREITQHEVSVSGVGNLLQRRDFDQSDVISFLDRRNDIRNLIDDSFSGIHVLFSDEDDDFIIGNSSLISSDFSKNGHVAGHLGLIGPMRIDYKKVIPYVEYFAEKISQMLSEDVPDELEINETDNNDSEETL